MTSRVPYGGGRVHSSRRWGGRRGRARRWCVAGSSIALLLLLRPFAGTAPGQQATDSSSIRLPFAPGERLTFRARAASVGAAGRGVMWVDGPVTVRGTPTYLLRFDVEARWGPLRASDQSASWLDPHRMAVLRTTDRERTPLSRRDEAVEVFPEEMRWRSDRGESGETLTDAPLDELSFIYFLRTLPLPPDTIYSFARHYDAARNPTTVRVVRHEQVNSGTTTYATVLLEMRVKDPTRYGGGRGEGVIRINLSDDDRRLPVRIVSTLPLVGAITLTLDSVTSPRAPALGSRAAEQNSPPSCRVSQSGLPRQQALWPPDTDSAFRPTVPLR